MDLSFNIDFDADEIHGIIDNSLSFTVIRDDDAFVYKNFDRIDDDIQNKIKGVCRVLLTLEDL